MNNIRLPPDANRIVFVRNLPDLINSVELYELFGKCGPIQEIRLGKTTSQETRGKAYVVYEDVFDAKTAVDTLSGQNVTGRYIDVMFYRPEKKDANYKANLQMKRKTIAALREKLQA
ncbi:splicing factor 3B subunit 6-like [Schistocerca gregaria]|uniref:splicing factor 3B subunit 6-like n=1 Tax=Schistocerca gregaria TaxID=7010 RepID=UPI00211DD372|nr:splicing factor 3B subunit 6-like [Schistocerca gregaria]